VARGLPPPHGPRKKSSCPAAGHDLLRRPEPRSGARGPTPARRRRRCGRAGPAGDEPLESGAGTRCAAFPTLGRRERHVTGRADAGVGGTSAEGPRLDDDGGRAGHRHRAATLPAARGGSGAGRPAGGPTGGLVHRLAAGGLAGLRGAAAGRGRGAAEAGATAPRTGRAELHERGTTAAAPAAEATRAAGGGSETRHGDRQAQRSAHDSWSPPPPDRGSPPQRSSVVRDDASKP